MDFPPCRNASGWTVSVCQRRQYPHVKTLCKLQRITEVPPPPSLQIEVCYVIEAYLPISPVSPIWGGGGQQEAHNAIS